MVYVAQLENYSGTDVTVQINAGSVGLQVRFLWDTISQRDMDQLDMEIKSLQDFHRLLYVGSSDYEINTDIFTFADNLALLLIGWRSWEPYAEAFHGGGLTPTDPEWREALENALVYQRAIHDTAYSSAVTGYLHFYEQWAALVDLLENSQDPIDIANMYDTIDIEPLHRIYAFNEQLEPIREEKSQLVELLHWYVTIDSDNVETRTCMLHTGTWIFSQENVYAIKFVSTKTDVGLDDLSTVIVYIDNKLEDSTT